MPEAKKHAAQVKLGDELLTMSEARDMLRVSERTLQRYAFDGTIPAIAIKQGRAKKTYRFPRAALEEWFNERATAAA